MIKFFYCIAFSLSVFINLLYSVKTLAYTTSNANPQNCVSCHQTSVNAWLTSDHAKAMDIATPKTVLGNFNNIEAAHYSQTARFYKQENKFFVELNHENKTNIYEINYTFGHYPLQQYLTKTSHGKYQVLPFSWDSRSKAEGGQKWFVMYQNEDIKQQDRLHWQQPLQSWNGMCADCHSDGLKRQYDIETSTFNTSFDNINVGCQSCHGNMNNHTKKTTSSTSSTRTQPDIINRWLRNIGEDTAHWQGKKRDNTFMDTCFACHSLRSSLTDGIVPEHSFLDQFSPSFLTPPLYHPDGQIKDEVYVYGSFLQSKMYKAGVNCIDCHDQHTMKVKVEGNGLCLQCHNPEVFDQPTHYNHKKGSAGSQCVDCHMPTNRYMGVDDRRDHSFKIPRPHLSTQHNMPNVCTNCHEDKSNEWAAKQVEKWHGKPKALSITYNNFLNIQNGVPITLNEHINTINDTSLSDIVRATAIAALINTQAVLSNQIITPWVTSDKPLIRLATAQVGQLVPIQERHLAFATLLADQYKAIRVAAANQLLTTNNINTTLMKKAFSELIDFNNNNAWRGEGNLNQSMVYYNSGQKDKAIASLQHAIKIDPYFSAAYINLADLYKSMGDLTNEHKTYKQALTATPQDAVVHYSYGLHLIRKKDKKRAVASFQQAIKLAPNNAQYIYLYVLAKDSIGETKQALMQLRRLIKKVDSPQQLAQLGLNFSQKMQDANSYQYFADILNSSFK